jgi:thiol-disulfide isomerase/thioredoxin
MAGRMIFRYILLIIFLVINLNFADSGKGEKAGDLELGSEAPAFSLPDLDNNYIFLRDLCGEKLRKPWINKVKQVVVLSFFATWCVPCNKEIPHLSELEKLFAEKPVKVFLVDVGEDREKVRLFLGKNKITLPVLFDQYQVVSEKYGANALPRLVVIDKEGNVRKYKKGFEDPSVFMSEMTNLLNSLSEE